jgi:hypothetical protein
MAGNMDMKLPLGQGSAIREIQKVRQQSFERNKPSPARRRRERKKQERPPHKFDSSSVDEHRQEGTGKKTKRNKDSKAPGSLLDIVV